MPFLGAHVDERLAAPPRPLTPALAKQPSTRPSCLERRGERTLHRRLVAHVAFERDDLAAGLGELGFGGRVLVGVGAPDGDVGAGLRHGQRHAEADAAIAAGDERHLAGEIEGLVHELLLAGWNCAPTVRSPTPASKG